MTVPPETFQKHIEQRDLVTLHRHDLDPHPIHGVLVAISDDLLLVREVFDFYLDGWYAVRRQDITALTHGDTNRFQAGLLRTEGVFDQIDFHTQLPIQSWRSLLSTRGPAEIVIVEDERSDPRRFFIGPISHLDRDTVYVQHFTGDATWLSEPEAIELRHITCVRLDGNYIRYYQRHFDRLAAKP